MFQELPEEKFSYFDIFSSLCIRCLLNLAGYSILEAYQIVPVGLISLLETLVNLSSNVVEVLN